MHHIKSSFNIMGSVRNRTKSDLTTTLCKIPIFVCFVLTLYLMEIKLSVSTSITNFISFDSNHSMTNTGCIDATNRGKLAMCSLQRLKQQFISEGSFPSDIQWQDGNFSNFMDVNSILSHTCDSTILNGDLGNISVCFQNKNISKIAIFGDSNGSRLSDALRMRLAPCNQVKKEADDPRSHPDRSYFLPNRPNVLTTTARGCKSCLSSYYICTGLGRPIVIEFISMEYTIDTEITTQRWAVLKASD